MTVENNKAVFFKGVRLWKSLKHWKPSPTAQGGGEKSGVSRKLGRVGGRSPNFLYDVTVHTAVPPVTAVSDLDRQGTFNVTMLQVQKSLVEASFPLGPLTWVQDITEKLDITAFTPPGGYPGAGSFTYNVGTAGFTPAAGDYILLREPDGEDGFVIQATAGGGGSVAASFPQAIDATWEALLARFHFPECRFLSMQGWESATQAEDSFAFNVVYLFRSQAHPVWATKYNITLGI